MLASFASLLLLALAVSLDGFGVGMTYGLRQIRIPARSVCIISCCSGIVILLSMTIGYGLIRWIPPHAASVIGAAILMAIGIWTLVRFVRGEAYAEQSRETAGKSSAGAGQASGTVTSAKPAQWSVWKLEIRQWGIVIQVLRTPVVADVDRSGTITAGEAFLLGSALSLDAFGAGIGAALVGFPPLLTSICIAGACGMFLWLGTRAGNRAAGLKWMKPMAVLPGIILILMGLSKLL
jgi:putative sporulation protein YtaF